MTPAASRASHKRSMDANGEPATLRRINMLPTPPTDLSIRVKVLNFSPDELVNGITTADRKVIVLAESLEGTAWPVPIAKNDKILLRGRTLNISEIDADKRRIAGTLIAYEITARG